MSKATTPSRKNNLGNYAKQQLHVHRTFLYISLASLHYYNVKMPNFTRIFSATQRYNVVTMLQRRVALKIVVANRLV